MSSFPIELCQHMKMSGDRCGAPALRDQKLCRFHKFCTPVTVDVSTSAQFPAAPFFLPVLEDASSIQLTIAQVCEHMLFRRLDSKQAGVLLYALQVASSNLDRLKEEKSQAKSRQIADQEKTGEEKNKNKINDEKPGKENASEENASEEKHVQTKTATVPLSEVAPSRNESSYLVEGPLPGETPLF
jgi:hypothetical protein